MTLWSALPWACKRRQLLSELAALGDRQLQELGVWRGARSGSGDEMAVAFHAEATIFGYVGDALFAGPIAMLFAWVEENGPTRELDARVASIDVAGRAATVRLELENWSGNKFTDLFTLLVVWPRPRAVEGIVLSRDS